MDSQYNEKLKAIMRKHNTDKWNSDCANDPDYSKAQAEQYGSRLPFDGKPYINENGVSSRQRRNPIGSVSIGSYRFKSKRK